MPCHSSLVIALIFSTNNINTPDTTRHAMGTIAPNVERRIANAPVSELSFVQLIITTTQSLHPLTIVPLLRGTVPPHRQSVKHRSMCPGNHNPNVERRVAGAPIIELFCVQLIITTN